VNIYVAIFATTGVILSAAYALWLYKRVVFGEITNKAIEELKDINAREYMILFPLAILIILFGVYPNMIIELTSASTSNLIENYNVAVDQYQSFINVQIAN
jgi:NADH-quinone oxidoreductase subunit M